MFTLRLSLIVLAAALLPAAAQAKRGHAHAVRSAVRHTIHAAHAAHHVAAKHAAKHHAAHPRKSPKRSTPKHHTTARKSTKPRTTAHKPAVHHTATRAFRSRPTTVNRTSNTTVNRTTVVYSTRGAGRRGSIRRGYYTRHTSVFGHRNWQSSRYSRRHVRRRTNTGAQTTVVRGVVDSTSGAAANGAVQIKMIPAANNRFQYGQAVNVPNNAKLKNYQVNNQTRFIQVTNARGGTRASSFKQLEPGQPVVILTPRGANNTFASSVEIFPLK